MNDVKSDVKQVIYGVIAITLILIIIAILFFGCGGDNTPIKSALSLMGNYVGAIATLAAAYIASMLFSDWREAQSTSNRSEHARKTLRSLIEIQSLLDNYKHKINLYCNYHPYEQNLMEFNKKYLEIRNDANDRYAELKAEYRLNAIYFLNVYDISLPLPSNEYDEFFDDYLYIINGAFNELYNIDSLYKKDIQNNVPIDVYLAAMDEKQSEFKNKIVASVYSKLTPHITLDKAS